MRPSFTGTGACLDNAFIESFWATLKKELVHQTTFATREEARAAIFEFIEVFYNRYRLHSSLDYTSPATFEARLDTKHLGLAA
jgi:putative transposase